MPEVEPLPPIAAAMVGPFWVVEEGGKPAIIALAVGLDRAIRYADMLTMDTGHLAYWWQLADQGAAALRSAGIPTAPVWSEYEEWPRGRVLYDPKARRFIIRADRKLHRPEFVRLVAERFGIAAVEVTVLYDDHYKSVRRVPLPAR